MMANPYFIQGPALISFSMGRSSGRLLHGILDDYDGKLPPDVHVATANTGDEDEASLRFGKACSEQWGVPIAVLEFDPEAEHRTRIVTWDTASRNGRPLDAAIDSRPTPHLYNPVSRYCTGTTKQRRLEKFARYWCGFAAWTSVRGIRADEQRRIASMAARSGRDNQTVALPLAAAGVTNDDVLAFWSEQPFDLELPVDESGATFGGNCKLCPLKKRSTLLRVLRVDPAAGDRMVARENRMASRIAEIPRRTAAAELRHRFFKSGEDFEALRREALSAASRDLFSDIEGGSVDCACTD